MPHKDEGTPSLEEIRAELLTQLYKAAKAGELKATALVQGVRAIAAAMPPPEPEKPVSDEEFSLLDRLPSLPKTHAKKLLKQEIGRLRQELESHLAALEEMEVPNADDHLE